MSELLLFHENVNPQRPSPISDGQCSHIHTTVLTSNIRLSSLWYCTKNFSLRGQHYANRTR